MNNFDTKKTIVVSGVNLVEAGPLSVFKDCLWQLTKWEKQKLTIIALVNSNTLFTEFGESGIRFLEYPAVKKSWLKRIIFEYRDCMDISKNYKPDVWFAMHDITPNVTAPMRIVYCHNPSPFYKLSLKEAWLEKPLFAFNLFYKFLYGINIQKNNYIIVQQQWIRDYFVKEYALYAQKVIVAYPDVKPKVLISVPSFKHKSLFRFIYPAYPRAFKNFEVLCMASEKLSALIENFEVIITLNGTENKYAAYLYNNYKYLKQIKFTGKLTRNEIFKLYEESDCLVFPSKLETWGLPITEMKMYNKPILVADCKYSHETVGNYEKACFFNPQDHMQLKDLMQNAVNNTLVYDKTDFTPPNNPFAQSWGELFAYFL
jgi:glycosyltransferase involved in cell wall biosynthesis